MNLSPLIENTRLPLGFSEPFSPTSFVATMASGNFSDSSLTASSAYLFSVLSIMGFVSISSSIPIDASLPFRPLFLDINLSSEMTGLGAMTSKGPSIAGMSAMAMSVLYFAADIRKLVSTITFCLIQTASLPCFPC
jgi:hypothetical protein